MKAKEYFVEYKKLLETEIFEIAIITQFNNMFQECQQIAEQRKAKANNAIISIFNEMNDKANSLIRMINKADDRGLYRDAFKIYIAQRTPDFALLIGWGEYIPKSK